MFQWSRHQRTMPRLIGHLCIAPRPHRAWSVKRDVTCSTSDGQPASQRPCTQRSVHHHDLDWRAVPLVGTV